MEFKENQNTVPQYISSSRGCCMAALTESGTTSIDQRRCCKMTSFNWLKETQNPPGEEWKTAEVRFKNGRKDFFTYPPEMTLQEGEIVAVESSPGHDIGIVCLTGDLVNLQMKRKKFNPEKKREMSKVFRHARLADVEKWLEAMALEDSTMHRTRVIAMDLNLEMKINDVEYQGDRTKAIFYYTADERVDFRQLIKKLAEAFRIRIEMRQIGMRQEAAKLGGIGSCGRELCCSSWMSGFQSVSTTNARMQQLSLNPQKLAGQCGKLKCCLNFEIDAYMDALEEFPDSRIVLKTKKGEASHQKSDVFRKVMWYAYLKDSTNMMAIPVDQVNQIIAMNKSGKLPPELEGFALKKEVKSNIELGGSDDYTVGF
jgi:cell fate regulator YaaT (PSP1 superfamily)